MTVKIGLVGTGTVGGGCLDIYNKHKDDFKRILSEPKNSLIMQYTSLLETEGVKLDITEDALDRMSTVAEEVNASAENIARFIRLIPLTTPVMFSNDTSKLETFPDINNKVSSFGTHPRVA